MLDDLQTVDWHRVYHAYGAADDVPALLVQASENNEASRAEAFHALWGNIVHQGTRWDASKYAVPFLAELATSTDITNREDFVWLLSGLAIGDQGSASLPFDPKAEFEVAERIDELEKSYIANQVEKFYAQPNQEDYDADLLDDLSICWARDAYRAVESELPRLYPLLASPDDDEAISVAHLSAWFPSRAVESVRELTQISLNRSVAFLTNANVALGYLGSYDIPDLVVHHLTARLTAPELAVRSSAAVGIVLALKPTAVSEAVLPPLMEMADYERPQDTLVSPFVWWRPLRGFAHLALQKLGLSP